MNGVHDMGGMHGFGKVEPEADEPVFHAPWEGRVLAMQRALGATGAWTIDASRYARERLPPDVYLATSYYWQWLLGVEANLVAYGLAGADDLGGDLTDGVDAEQDSGAGQCALRCGRARTGSTAARRPGCRGR